MKIEIVKNFMTIKDLKIGDVASLHESPNCVLYRTENGYVYIGSHGRGEYYSLEDGGVWSARVNFIGTLDVTQ